MKSDRRFKSIPWLALVLVCGMAATPCPAGAPAPPVSEAGELARIQMLKASQAEIIPGDNAPRTTRLAHALYSLARFYNDNKAYEKADQYYGETLALVSEDKSDWRPGNLRYYSHAMGSDYMARGDLAKAKGHLDRALKICREDSKQKEVLPSVLTTLAEWQRQMKQFDEAEATLLEAIGLSESFATDQQVALAKIHLETKQFAKADKTIEGLEKSTFMSYRASVVMFLRAQWLRATGKMAEAEALDAKARAAEAKELEHLKNSQ